MDRCTSRLLVGALKLLSSVIVGGWKPQEVALWGDSPAEVFRDPNQVQWEVII